MEPVSLTYTYVILDVIVSLLQEQSERSTDTSSQHDSVITGARSL